MIGVRARSQSALLEFQSEQRGGIDRQHAHCIAQRSPERHDISQSTIQRQCAARQLPFRVATNSAAYRHLNVPQLIFSVRHSGGGDAVAR